MLINNIIPAFNLENDGKALNLRVRSIMQMQTREVIKNKLKMHCLHHVMIGNHCQCQPQAGRLAS